MKETDYIFQKWSEWILIILKYRNGMEFLDSPDLTDNDFDNMIDNADYNKTDLNNKWIFDAEEAFNTILYPKDNVNNKIIDSVVKEVPGGAHRFPKEQAKILEKNILETLESLNSINGELKRKNAFPLKNMFFVEKIVFVKNRCS